MLRRHTPARPAPAARSCGAGRGRAPRPRAGRAGSLRRTRRRRRRGRATRRRRRRAIRPARMRTADEHLGDERGRPLAEPNRHHAFGLSLAATFARVPGSSGESARTATSSSQRREAGLGNPSSTRSSGRWPTPARCGAPPGGGVWSLYGAFRSREPGWPYRSAPGARPSAPGQIPRAPASRTIRGKRHSESQLRAPAVMSSRVSCSPRPARRHACRRGGAWRDCEASAPRRPGSCPFPGGPFSPGARRQARPSPSGQAFGA